MCFGVVIAKRNDNNCYKEEITNLLNDNIKRVEEYYLNKKLLSINPIVNLGKSIKTRRWIWRQGKVRKITSKTRNIFVPIDGFTKSKLESVIRARDELANLFKEFFDCEVIVGFIDKGNKEMNF